MRIALLGVGQIARSHHLPAIDADPALTLVAAVDPSGTAIADDIACFPTFDALLASGITLDAVSICTPPRIRHALARRALCAGLDVMMEKPPAQTTAEARDLAMLAREAGTTLFAAWHSRYSQSVPEARRIVAARGLRRMRIIWRENSEKWHPGTRWFWEPGGFGAFDAGINGIALAQAILPGTLMLRDATLLVRPGDHAPMRADVAFALSGHDSPITAVFDSGHHGLDETWTIACELADGTRLDIAEGGARLVHDGRTLISPHAGQASSLDAEYPALYARFAHLAAQGMSDVDTTPLQLVTDILAFGRRDIFTGPA